MNINEIKIINKIKINGECLDLDSLPLEKRQEISRELNRRALAAAGYVPVKKTETA